VEILSSEEWQIARYKRAGYVEVKQPKKQVKRGSQKRNVQSDPPVAGNDAGGDG
jgi:hypothetical protein